MSKIQIIFRESDIALSSESSALPSLGAKIQLCLVEGRSPDDALLVELVVKAIQKLSLTPSGWILVDFPKTKEQAVLLERQLTGYEEPKPIKKGDLKRTKEMGNPEQKKSLIISSETNSPHTSTHPASCINCVFLLDVSNDVSFARANGEYIDPISSKKYHIQLDPPPKNQPVIKLFH